MKTSDILPEYLLGHPKDQPRRTNISPEQKTPKARPPRSLRDKIPYYGKLPPYSGPYEVGLIDLEVPVRNPRHFSEIKRHHKYALVLETVLLTIYYPAHYNSGNDTLIQKAKGQHNSRPTWLARPRDCTAKGYGRCASLPPHLTLAWFFMTTWLTKLPAYRNARLAEHWPESDNSWHNRQGQGRPGPKPENGPEKPIFPLLIFSHGLGGTKTCYSSICGEFASHGFIVCAVEHRDGSGPRTLVNHCPLAPEQRAEAEKAGKVVNSKHHSKARTHDMVDFIFPQADKQDTLPDHEIDHELREAQIDMRLAELDEAFHIMTRIFEGHGNEYKDRNLRKKGTPGASSRGLDGVDFLTFHKRFHIDNVTIIGHSFGAATAVEMMRRREEYPYVTQGIIYDVWGMPIRAGTPGHQVKTPILGVNSEAFMYWDANFDVVESVTREARAAGQPAWLMTVRGTVHISQSDFCILYPRLARNLMKITMDPVRAIDVNIDASLDFLSRTLFFKDATGKEEEQAWRRNLPKKRLLDLDTVEELPTEHKPKERWTAMRLRIQHEGRKRIVPGHRTKYWDKLKSRGEEEIWLHLAPGMDDKLHEDDAEYQGEYDDETLDGSNDEEAVRQKKSKEYDD